MTGSHGEACTCCECNPAHNPPHNPPPDPNPPQNAAYWKRRALKAEEELAYRKNNFEQSCLWPSTIIESDQRMPDGRPTKLAVVPNWCIHKIECNARNMKPEAASPITG